MDSIAVTTGAVRARDCPEEKSILQALDELAESMDQQAIEGIPYGTRNAAPRLGGRRSPRGRCTFRPRRLAGAVGTDGRALGAVRRVAPEAVGPDQLPALAAADDRLPHAGHLPGRFPAALFDAPGCGRGSGKPSVIDISRTWHATHGIAAASGTPGSFVADSCMTEEDSCGRLGVQVRPAVAFGSSRAGGPEEPFRVRLAGPSSLRGGRP